MRLYTIQPLSFWEEAQTKGVMTPLPNLVEQDFLAAYNWMREQMQKRLPSFSGDFPIWAWVARPDLRRYCQDGFHDEPYALLTLDIPAERFIISDVTAWTGIMNTLAHLHSDEGKAWLSRLGGQTVQKIRDEWERIFETDNSNMRLQACIDRVYPHEVVAVTPIKQRKRKGA